MSPDARRAPGPEPNRAPRPEQGRTRTPSAGESGRRPARALLCAALEDHEIVVDGVPRKRDDVGSIPVDAAHPEVALDDGPVVVGVTHEGSALQLSELPAEE